MKYLIILTMFSSLSANAQYMNQLNEQYNGVDGSANPLHPRPAQEFHYQPIEQIAPQPQQIRSVQCQTVGSTVFCQ